MESGSLYAFHGSSHPARVLSLNGTEFRLPHTPKEKRKKRKKFKKDKKKDSFPSGEVAF